MGLAAMIALVCVILFTGLFVNKRKTHRSLSPKTVARLEKREPVEQTAVRIARCKKIWRNRHGKQIT